MFAGRPAGSTAVTTVERFVMLGAVFIEVEPTSPSTVDLLTMKGEMSAPVYSQWAISIHVQMLSAIIR